MEFDMPQINWRDIAAFMTVGTVVLKLVLWLWGNARGWLWRQFCSIVALGLMVNEGVRKLRRSHRRQVRKVRALIGKGKENDVPPKPALPYPTPDGGGHASHSGVVVVMSAL
jgi:hypothetical protein